MLTATNRSELTTSAVQTLTQSAPETPTDAGGITYSPNWSGYVVPSNSALITDVGGAWTVPALDCSNTPNNGVSFWVGIGGSAWPPGVGSGPLLQTGIRTDCVNGTQENTGWFQQYPSTPNGERAFAGFAISSGDSIEASVSQRSDGRWETRVDDLTTGLSGVMVTGLAWGVMSDGDSSTLSPQGFATNLSYSGGYTAEWIVEDFARYGLLVPLADYGTVSFTNLRTSLPSWALTPDEGWAIATNGGVVSMPSPPADSGFSVSYRG
jgi:hypothetical protein